MAGEMCKEEVTRESYPFHFALADALGCEVEPFDQYQGPYVDSKQGNLFLSTEDGVLCQWANTNTRESSSEFLACEDKNFGYEPAILESNAAAAEIVKFPPKQEYDVILSKSYRVSGTMKMEAPNAQTALRLVQEMMDSERNSLQIDDPRIEWNDEHDYIDDTFVIDDVE